MTVIQINNVHKKFKVFYDKSQSFKEKLLFRNRNHYEDRWVLNGIDFEVQKGEAIGLIGQNGCGKSTLLKLMTKIMYPDKGSIQIQGRVSSLIELGAGFHPDMSGRENIYTNASIFGLTRKEIDKRVQQIIDFSELKEFIDNPVRTYSSGMYMRLAFAVAINVDADVLLIDEILAVGDASFQSKCFSKLREIKASGTTIVIVSHSLGQIEQICDKSIWIEQGIIREAGIPHHVHPVYMEFMGVKQHHTIPIQLESELDSAHKYDALSAQSDDLKSSLAVNRWGNRDVEISSVQLQNENREEINVYRTGQKMNIIVEYQVNNPITNAVVGIGVFRNDGVYCYGTNTMIDHIDVPLLEQNGVITCEIHKNNLLEGEYLLDVAFHAEDGFAYDYYRDAKRFRVYSVLADAGVTRLDHNWRLC